MWDDDENEGADILGDAEVNVSSEQDLAEGRLLAFFDEMDTVRFLAAATDQEGDKFRFGAEVRMRDSDPDVFDCSELVEWSAHQAGVKMPDGSWNQFKHLDRAGSTTSIDEALGTPGALLFRFGSDPLTTKGRPKGAHVAISLGDGRVLEATTGGVRIVERTEGWTHAGVIPGLEVAEDSPIWGDRRTGETLGEDPAFDPGDEAVPPTADDEPQADTEQHVDDQPPAAGQGDIDDPQATDEQPPATEVEPGANRYQVDGAPAPATAPSFAIFDDVDLLRIGRALGEGRDIAMGSNGKVYIGKRGEYEPMTESAEEFIESRLGEMKLMAETGVSIAIRPDGTFNGQRSDGRLKVFGGPDAELDEQEVSLITEYLRSGSRVNVHADGMIELRDVPGDPEPSAEEGQRLAREFVRLHDSGELAQQMADGKMLTITHDTVEFAPSPSFAAGGELPTPSDVLDEQDSGSEVSEPGSDGPADSPADGTPAGDGSRETDHDGDPGDEEIGDQPPAAEVELGANHYLVEGAPTPDTAPSDAMFGQRGLERIGQALSQGRDIAMGSNGKVNVGKRVEYEPMTESAEEFIEARLGEMKEMAEAGLMVQIAPDGEFTASRADGYLAVFGGPDTELDLMELSLITGHLSSGGRVQVHADGMIELAEVPGAPELSAEEGQRLASEFDRLHDSGELARQMADGKMLTISHDTVEFTPSPSFAAGAELPTPNDVLNEQDTSFEDFEPGSDGPADSPAEGAPMGSGSGEADDDVASDGDGGGVGEDGTFIDMEPMIIKARPSGGVVGGGDDVASDGDGDVDVDEEAAQTREEELREDAAEARRFEQVLGRVADSHRSMRDEFRLEKLRLENRIEALDDRENEVSRDLTRWDEDIKVAEGQVAELTGRISALEREDDNEDEVSGLRALRTIAVEELRELGDHRSPGYTELGEIEQLRSDLNEEQVEVDVQIGAHDRMYDDMDGLSESAEDLSIRLLGEARDAAGKEREGREDETDSEVAARLERDADRHENLSIQASRAADASAAHADRLAVQISSLQNRVRAEKARDERLDREVDTMREEEQESTDLAERLEGRARESRLAGNTDEAEVYERRALAAQARSAGVGSAIRRLEQGDSRGGTASGGAVSLYERQLVRLGREYESVAAEVVEFRELSTSYAAQAEGIEVMAQVMDRTVEPRPDGDPLDVDVDVVSGADPLDHDREEVDEDLDSDSDSDSDSDDNDVDGGGDVGDEGTFIEMEPMIIEARPAGAEDGDPAASSALDELEESLDELTGDMGTDGMSDVGQTDPLIDQPATVAEEPGGDLASEPVGVDEGDFISGGDDLDDFDAAE